MELQHFSHEHPLIFHQGREYYDDDENLQKCNGCVETIFSTTPSYHCKEYCSFYLHKSCAELSLQKNHILHPQHPLTLLDKPLYDRPVCWCDCCGSEWANFTYNCSICKFDLDVACGSMMDLKIEHRSHQHPLTRITRSGLFLCDACGIKHEGIFYFCTTCPESQSFFIHQDCVLLRTTINLCDHHEHPLALAYSTPSEYDGFYNYCEICSEEVVDEYASYYCSECLYFVHTNCATSRNEPFMSILHPWNKADGDRFQVVDPGPDVVQLPVLDESVNLINHFVPGIETESKIKDQFTHFSHDHQLILSNEHEEEDDILILEGKCCGLHNKKNDQILCNACIRPIITTTPFYRCIEKCGFFLHVPCAELRTEVQHPGHTQHPLILLPRSATPLGVFWCKGCRYDCNGFVYRCDDCNYDLDVVCGSLPISIQHESHKEHILSIQPSLSTRCHASGYLKEDAGSRGFSFAYHCKTCNYEVYPKWITLPREIRHRYDEEHPFILTYSPVKATHHEGQYICDISERELDPREWFYHCVDCDHSITCINRSQFGWWSNLKFGGTFTIDRHPHRLTLLPVIRPNAFFFRYPHVIINDIECNTIGRCVYWKRRHLDRSGVKCLECDFKIHYCCALENGEFDGLAPVFLKSYHPLHY